MRELDVYHTKHEGKEGVSPLKNQKTGGFRESRFSQQCGGAGQRPDAKKLDDDDDVSSRNDDDETNSELSRRRQKSKVQVRKGRLLSMHMLLITASDHKFHIK